MRGRGKTSWEAWKTTGAASARMGAGDMELRQPRYFCRACEEGSYTAAAEGLFVTEQTISAAIKKLERELGCELLFRGKGGVVPTPAGEVLYEKGTAMLNLAEDAVRAMARKRTERPCVRFDSVLLGIPERGAFSTQAIDDFCAAYPCIDVELSEHSTEKCIKHVLNGEADLAFVYDGVEDEDLEVHHLGDGEVVVAMTPDNPLASLGCVTYADLRGQTILSCGQGGAAFRALAKQCAMRGFEPTVRTVPALYYLDMAAEGKGVAFALAGHPMLGGGRNLIALPFRPTGTEEGDRVTTPMNLVLRRDRRPKSPARLLASWLLEVWGTGGSRGLAITHQEAPGPGARFLDADPISG